MYYIHDNTSIDGDEIGVSLILISWVEKLVSLVFPQNTLIGLLLHAEYSPTF